MKVKRRDSHFISSSTTVPHATVKLALVRSHLAKLSDQLEELIRGNFPPRVCAAGLHEHIRKTQRPQNHLRVARLEALPNPSHDFVHPDVLFMHQKACLLHRLLG